MKTWKSKWYTSDGRVVSFTHKIPGIEQAIIDFIDKASDKQIDEFCCQLIKKMENLEGQMK